MVIYITSEKTLLLVNCRGHSSSRKDPEACYLDPHPLCQEYLRGRIFLVVYGSQNIYNMSQVYIVTTENLS